MKNNFHEINASPIQNTNNNELNPEIRILEFEDDENENQFKIVFPPSKRKIDNCDSITLKESLKNLKPNSLKEKKSVINKVDNTENSFLPTDSKSLFLKKAKNQMIKEHKIEIKAKNPKEEQNLKTFSFDAIRFEKVEKGKIFER